MDDLISRQAAIDAIRASTSKYTGFMEMEMYTDDDAVEAINGVPSAQPTEASCWGCNCPKMERLKEQKTFSEMVHLHDAETHSCDLISRQAAIDSIIAEGRDVDSHYLESECIIHESDAVEAIAMLPSAQQWIPCSERLPGNTEPVNITWVNRKPEPYYADIKDKLFTATGHYHNGKWWWYSAVCQDYLDEYGECEMDEMDGDIEVTAWMPLPEPYKGEKS